MRHTVFAVAALLTLSSYLAGQETLAVSTTVPPRWHAGAAVEVGHPVGALGHHLRNATGAQAHLLLRLNARGTTALRLEGAWLNYGHESKPVCLAVTPGCRIATHVATTNNILSLGVGPEFSVQRGAFRLSGHGLVGVSRFSTLSALDGGILPDFVAADENFGDTGIFWSVGGGIQLPITERVSLHLGVAFQRHGRREYLTEGGLTDNPDGSLTVDIKRSAADLFAVRLGFSRSLSWGSGTSTP